MHIPPRCHHGPLCTGAPLHLALLPANAFEMALHRYWLIIGVGGALGVGVGLLIGALSIGVLP